MKVGTDMPATGHLLVPKLATLQLKPDTERYPVRVTRYVNSGILHQ